MATIQKQLWDIFDELGGDDLTKFKKTLTNRCGEPRVKKGEMERVKDTGDLAELMVSRFTSSGAVAVAVEVFNDIGANETAKQLLRNTGQNPAGPAVPPGGPSDPSGGLISPSGEHFIDRNFTELIERVNNVNPILDILRQKKVITDEDYSSICGKHSKPEKMRELLMGPIKSAGSRGKDILYQALKLKEQFLMEELQ